MIKKIIFAMSILLVLTGVLILSLPFASNIKYKIDADKSYKVFSNKYGNDEVYKAENNNSTFKKGNGKKYLNKKSKNDNDKQSFRTNDYINTIGHKNSKEDRNSKGVSYKPLSELFEILDKRNKDYIVQNRLPSGLNDDINLSEYGFTNDIFGFIIIDKIGVKLPIYLGATNENLTKGAAHMTGSIYPVGQAYGNCIIVAHKNYTWSSMFNDLYKLKNGDIVRIEDFAGKFVYKVTNRLDIPFTDYRPAVVQSEGSYLTLCTCKWNDRNRTYDRFVVVCKRID